MLRTKLIDPTGTLVQAIAGDVPCPGSVLSADRPNLSGISPPSGSAEITNVKGGRTSVCRSGACPADERTASTVAINPALTVHIDGEFFSRPEDRLQELDIQMLPRALKVRCALVN